MSSRPSAQLEDLLARKLDVQDRKDSLVARIALDVGAQIVDGHLAPGDDLNSVELAKRFDSSRTPVREALLLLEKQGLVEVPARRRPVVADFTQVPIRTIYESRALLTGYMARKITLEWQGEDLVPLEQCVERMVAAAEEGDSNAYFWANMELSELSGALAGNELVKKFVDSIGLVSIRLRRRSLSKPGRIEASARDHVRIMEAYRRRDGALASALAVGLVRDGYIALTGHTAPDWFFG